MFDKVISKILNNEEKEFHEIHVQRDVIETITDMGQSSDPYEFMCLLEGNFKNNILTITGLIFLPTDTSSEGAIMHTGMLPVTMDHLGSVHSHPGPSNMPSETDLITFSKMGLFHMIICRPYEIENIMSYNRFGEFVPYKIVESTSQVSSVMDDLIDDEDLLRDDDFY
ncbi:Mov34/MPN/PAD-1 family protein [Methanobrevibacter filiformis]|uniref:Mov34/MPN/PAD-1 family protein n=1 Tax=Methanobrevibacter filiformis TaxID=55758 RepID=A0A166CVU4_9EURY|nr:Mov34/MPN/PAD-1 family protein [Methanobrevibacter filiformis]KZX14916.1 Mov34/MPN/PAD-1 family protein [Methanobrevibacter filiformis]